MINRVTLVGNAGCDADLMPVGASDVSRFSLATSESYIDKKGTRVSTTEWHRITCWNGLAKIAHQYVRKGAQVYVEGKIKYGSFEKDGVKHNTVEIVAETFKLLGVRRDDNGAPVPAQAPAPATAPAQNAGDGNDDLPF